MAADLPVQRFRVRLGPAGARLVFLSILLTLLATAFSLWLPRYLGIMVDRLVSGGLSPRALLEMGGIYLAAALIGAFFSKTMRQIPMRLGPRISHLLRSDLYAHLLRLDDEQVRKHRIGDLMSRLSSDVNAVAEMISLGGHSTIRALFTLGGAFWVMSARNGPLALLKAILLPMMILIGFLLLRSIRRRHLAVQEQLGELTTYCQESFHGIRIVKGMGIEDHRIATFRGINDEYIHRNMVLSRVEVPAWPLMHAGFLLGNVALLWIGGQQVIAGDLSLGMLVEFQQYLMVLQWPTLSLAWTLSLLFRGRASLSRLRAVTNEAPRLEDGEHTRHDTDLSTGDLEFRNVSLTLNEHRVLHDISFRVRRGERLGITGPTGSGKTMLLNLLLRRFDPDAGSIHIGPHDLRSVSASDLYRLIRMAPQEPILFSMTLGENLRLAQPEADVAALREVLRLSALDQDLQELPCGLDTLIGERGVTLSGGQRQRCAIARALLAAPELLLLDDSLSAVDTATEQMILDRLLPFLRTRTAIIVSHRYATLRHCDTLLVLRDGRIEQSGPPDVLRATPGYFAELCERQRLESELEALNAG